MGSEFLGWFPACLALHNGSHPQMVQISEDSAAVSTENLVHYVKKQQASVGSYRAQSAALTFHLGFL